MQRAQDLMDTIVDLPGSNVALNKASSEADRHATDFIPVPTKLFSSWQNELAYRRRGSSCFVVLTHVLDEVALDRYRIVRSALGHHRDVFLVMTRPSAPASVPIDPAEVTWLSDVDIFDEAYGKKGEPRRVTPGNTDLVMLAFARRHPGYHHYWMIEYDVFFPSGPGMLATLDAASAADLLVLHIGRREPTATWPRWNTLVVGELPPRAHHSVMPTGPIHHTSGLFPVSRYSAALLATLDWSYRNGWAGHHEAAVPTIAATSGLSIEHLNSVCERALGHPFCDPGGFHYRECSPRTLDPRCAYHPIKTAAATAALLAALGGAGVPS